MLVFVLSSLSAYSLTSAASLYHCDHTDLVAFLISVRKLKGPNCTRAQEIYTDACGSILLEVHRRSQLARFTSISHFQGATRRQSTLDALTYACQTRRLYFAHQFLAKNVLACARVSKKTTCTSKSIFIFLLVGLGG